VSRTQAPDLNQVPAALIERVEILTGGASAVYGADAVAGVVNFIIDREFEGVRASAGISGYQHENRNSYMQDLQRQRGFDFPTGSSGIDGITYDFRLRVGFGLDGGRGHASGYMTYRKNESQFQGDRDYFSCALLASGTACGGSSTAIVPNFLLTADTNTGSNFNSSFVSFDSAGTWRRGIGELYNYAPVNFLQRPDERWTAGGFFSYNVSPLFNPYLDIAFANTATTVQIAETGTFFTDTLNVSSVLIRCLTRFAPTWTSSMAPAPMWRSASVSVTWKAVSAAPRSTPPLGAGRWAPRVISVAAGRMTRP
jgi:iron complex outermembrane receptor protein